MRSLVVFAVLGLALSGCVGSSGGSTRTCVTKVTGPDGRQNTVVAEVTGAITAKDGICEGSYASEEEVIQAMFATPGAGAPAPAQQSKAKVTETAPVKAAPAAPAKPAPAPERKAPLASRTDYSYTGVPACSLTFSGGTGYACAYSN